MMTRTDTSTLRKPAQGSAVIVVLALLAIMMIFVTASFVAERTLGRELKQIEKKQLQRLEGHPSSQTNFPAANPDHG